MSFLLTLLECLFASASERSWPTNVLPHIRNTDRHNTRSSRGKYMVVRHDGCDRRYSVNQYGEVYEEERHVIS
jgi:hypothetical protein